MGSCMCVLAEAFPISLSYYPPFVTLRLSLSLTIPLLYPLSNSLPPPLTWLGLLADELAGITHTVSAMSQHVGGGVRVTCTGGVARLVPRTQLSRAGSGQGVLVAAATGTLTAAFAQYRAVLLTTVELRTRM